VSELHPRLAELRVELERTRTALLETIAAVPADAAATVPAPGTWSVAEIVEHLQIVEDGIGRRLGQLAKQAELLGAETESTSVLGALDRFSLRVRSRAIKAPAGVTPTGVRTLSESIAALGISRARLLELLRRVSGRALSELKAPHPLIGPLDFYQWLLFLAQHEERHAAQIRETLSRLSDPASAGRDNTTL
jgi:uncharacterized damage-inducible protein DinB